MRYELVGLCVWHHDSPKMDFSSSRSILNAQLLTLMWEGRDASGVLLAPLWSFFYLCSLGSQTITKVFSYDEILPFDDKTENIHRGKFAPWWIPLPFRSLQICRIKRCCPTNQPLSQNEERILGICQKIIEHFLPCKRFPLLSDLSSCWAILGVLFCNAHHGSWVPIEITCRPCRISIVEKGAKASFPWARFEPPKSVLHLVWANDLLRSLT